MARKHYAKPKKGIRIRKSLIVILSLIILISGCYVAYFFYEDWKSKSYMEELANSVDEAFKEDAINATEPNSEDSRVLKELADLKKENSDLVGWIKIDGTNINYPVVQIEGDNDYYLNHDFKKEYSELGAIYLDKDCSTTKPTDNFLIYGHRNVTGQMFETLTNYKEESFYKKHPTFKFATLEEVGEYEIIAVFQSQVYLKNQDVFKYYFFKDAENEEEFNNYIKNIKKISMYDIEETASYGDQLITLSTCDYHVEDGRFAVVAKKIN